MCVCVEHARLTETSRLGNQVLSRSLKGGPCGIERSGNRVRVCRSRPPHEVQKQRSSRPLAKAVSTLRFSRAVPHRGTNRAFRRLTSEFRWDRVFSTKYGRRRSLDAPCGCSSASGEAKLVAPNRCEKDTTFSRDLCFRAIFTSPGTMPCIPTKKCDQKNRDEDSAWCWCLNRWDEKEGCAERIARVGTLSQNGYGEYLTAPKRALTGRGSSGVEPGGSDRSTPPHFFCIPRHPEYECGRRQARPEPP